MSTRRALAEEPVKFNRDVLPILADRCFACHGFDQAKREAGLRLDQRESAVARLESGEFAIVPRDAARSELLKRVSAADATQRMPPPDAGPPLTAAQQATLRRWIEQGAEYERHWAFVAPKKVDPPAVAGVEQPIDRFVRSRLVAEKIEPSPEADRATLVRRLSLDLIGLPPSP
ncbi:MAG TPA: DUF1549 domain-containing protein, partial [Pirellulaceae bacterium]|nr:DUF1549 domain-containing protein [Pirellulaceae bacterium]